MLTAISFALGTPLLAAVVFMGLMLQRNANIPGLGPPELAIAAGNIALIVGLGLAGLITGLGALHQVRLSGGRIRGLKRALFSTLTWPTLTLLGLVALATSTSLGGFITGGRAFAPKFVLTAVLALAAGTMLVFAVWCWAVVVPNSRRTADNLAVLGITACLLLVPSFLASFFSGILPVLKAVNRAAAATTMSRTIQLSAATNWTHSVSLPKVVSTTVAVEVTSPPNETFIVTGIVLSNGVPVSGRDLRAKLAPSSGREPSRFAVRWQTVEPSAAETVEVPWEIVVEDKSAGTIAARLRPTNMPRLTWAVSPNAASPRARSVAREAFVFEVARALQTAGGGDGGVADWSVRLQFQSAPPQPSASKRGIAADFVLPAHQSAVFEVVTRSKQAIVPVPRLATYVVNGAPDSYVGRFLWADDPENLDGQTGLPRWKFGIIGPDGSSLEQGLGVSPALAKYAGNLDLWAALKPDCEVIEGLPSSPPSQSACGLRIRTQSYNTAPGQTYRSVGRGTNWTASAASSAVPTPQ